LSFAGKINWIWVDCFTKFPLTSASYYQLKSLGFKLCLVSPELQSGNSTTLTDFKQFIAHKSFTFDAICTKYPFHWSSLNV